MTKGASNDSRTAEFRIMNTSMKLKRVIMNIAKSEGRTLTQFVVREFKKIADNAPDSARNFQDNYDGC